MTATVSIFDLCRQTFGEVKAAWREPLETMERTHSAADLQEAFGKAKEHEANSLGYVETILQNKRTPSQNGPKASEANKLLCAVCELPHWIDNMTVRLGLGVCRACAERLGPDTEDWSGEWMKPSAVRVQEYWAAKEAGS